MAANAALFRLLGDEARLRILRLLDAERLNVTELTSILGIAQSGVSRHLGLLNDAGLVEERRDGGFTFFRLAPGLQNGENGFGPVWPLLTEQFAAAAATAEGRADAARLEEVRRVRKENFDEDHNQHGADADRRQIVPGRSWAAWARALGHLLPPLEIADLGCGDGYLTIEAARFAKRVIAVDRSEAALTRAKQLVRRKQSAHAAAGFAPIEWKKGEIEKLPLKDASVDVALLSQALHHAASPSKALAEAVRILRPGGRVVILDLRKHGEPWVRERLGDKWLGFDDKELETLMKHAGLTGVRVTIGARRARDPFTVLIASGAKDTTKDTKKAKVAKDRHV
jgi:ubiquinone/menaquinone biosynthesis C-methylase UbiE/DNA-binding transcriptional ArsR family regulator